ncbi:N-acetylmuramic acid 6-phosphate etherase [Spirulina sp. 06S082]|nr:N-acetylmuramic acid 6-phosphate etherase [Spirulina sp. 06S082]MEA5468511.1 N-acetylmuramic acid 6-phosphate etherase [Spirulina sp. 06S082]
MAINIQLPVISYPMLESRGHLLTEQINPNSQNLDRLTSLELVDLFNQEDRKNLQAIAAARSELAKAIDLTAASLSRGGRLFYVGAGTSGRLGVLDAAECPPTFCTPPELVQGILAGGAPALLKSSEALEDRREDGAQEIAQKEVTAVDVVLGITAGGTTPFVHGAIAEAKKRGATTIFLACVPASQFKIDVDVDLRLLVGPEILAGSTRLKAGTVTKMALNILSTSVMVKLGKTYGNRMIDVSVTNQKLRDRALRILQDLADLDRQEAETLLDRSGQKVKLALLMHWGGVSLEKGNQCLEEARGNLRTALELANR